MDTTVRNLDEQVYRELKAQAALQGVTLGEALNEAIRGWLAGARPVTRQGSLAELRPQSWGGGNEKASEQIDRMLYGDRS